MKYSAGLVANWAAACDTRPLLNLKYLLGDRAMFCLLSYYAGETVERSEAWRQFFKIGVFPVGHGFFAMNQKTCRPDLGLHEGRNVLDTKSNF